MLFFAIILLVATAIGGGTALAAQNALPGEMLWGFKVTVTEGVAGALTHSLQDKAYGNIHSVEARLNEAHLLAAKGALNIQTQIHIESNLASHISKAAHSISRLEAEGKMREATDAAVSLQAVLARNATTFSDSLLAGAIHAALDMASELSAHTSAAAAAESKI